MKTAEIRQKFLSFFGKNDHVVCNSFSLIPVDDPTLLFNSAGMAPFKPYFLGIKTDMKRAASCQKCFRTTDIENVGYTARHNTFFEMLGNFSFGDYFKKEAIAWGWEFCTKTIGLPSDKLYVSVHLSDNEAYDIWNKDFNLPPSRIIKLGDKDNFWTIGVGPSGPCSEIYIDQGPELGCGNPNCAPGCDCPRFLEFWNLVFTQYNRAEDGTLTPLEKKNIDTGMGLERLAAIVQGKIDNFQNDVFQGIISKVEALSARKFGESEQITTALKVVADHVRALSFAIADGAFPGNEGRGYVLRKILRRASRFGYRYLGQEKPFLHSIVSTVADVLTHYPELKERAGHIEKVVHGEEERFLATLKTGSDILVGYLADVRKAGENFLDGKKAFLLHDTYGFPLDLTKEICREEKISVDEEGFSSELEKQRARGRANVIAGFTSGSEGKTGLNQFPPTKFVGYESLDAEAKILGILETKEGCILVTDVSPFYGTSGGQVGDFGIVKTEDKIFTVEAADRHEEIILHHGTWGNSAPFSVGDTVKMEVDKNSRRSIMRNHTATHLLHKALREFLGNHVKQAGSLVAPDRLRFDFTHYESIDPGVLENIEREINSQILLGLPVTTTEMSFDEAVGSGAMALFGEKYGDRVRVVKVGDYSTELCGGTHLKNSAEIGLFCISSESSIASGIRRIEAITGVASIDKVKRLQLEQTQLAQTLECDRGSLLEKVQKLIQEQKELKLELENRRKKVARESLEDLKGKARKIGEISAIISQLEGISMNEMKEICDDLVGDNQKTLALIACGGEKVDFVLKISKDLTGKLNAGKLIKEIAKVTGGSGGGRPDMATAGGKDSSKIGEALALCVKLLTHLIDGE